MVKVYMIGEGKIQLFSYFRMQVYDFKIFQVHQHNALAQYSSLDLIY